MKKVFKIILIIILSIPFLVSAKSYEINKYKIKIDLDDNWDVFTLDNIKDNDNLIKYNITYEYLYNFMQDNSVYLDAIYQKDTEMFIRIKSGLSEINNLSNFEASDLNEMADQLVKKTGATEYDIIDGDITYIKSSYYDNNAKAYILEYVTVVNGNNITFTIQNYNSYISETLENDVDKAIDSTYIEIDQNKTKENKSVAFDYNTVLQYTIIGAIIGGFVGMILKVFSLNKNGKKNNANKKEDNS